MRAFLLFAVLALDASAQAIDMGRFARTNARCAGGRSSRGLPCDDGAFFEFAPASGAGMGTACACTAVTGAKGEAMTFTRTGDATCSKQGLATTGIANGDLVVCTANQPRVESSGGVLGLRVEGARTNLLPRSAAFDNAAWTKEQDAAPRTPTVTADQAVAPDGTTTADYFDSPATSGVQSSDAYQTGTGSSATNGWNCSLYVKGVSGSGTTDLCVYAGGAAWDCAACSFVSTSWSRCSTQTVNAPVGTVSRYCKIGNNSLQNGAVARSRSEMYIWGMQGEESFYPTAYIPTVAAAVTRNVESADVALPFSPTAGLCLASTIEYPSLQVLRAGGGTYGQILTDSALGSPLNAALYIWPFSGVTGGQIAVDSSGVMSAGAVSYLPAVASTNPGRYVTRHPGGVAGWTSCTNASCLTNGTTSTWGAPAFTKMMLGPASASSANQTSHIVSRVQVDPSPSRCTP